MGVRIGGPKNNARNITVKDSVIKENQRDGIYVDYVTNLKIHDNNIHTNDLSWTAGDSIQLHKCNDFDIKGNTLKNHIAREKGNCVLVKCRQGRIAQNKLLKSNFGLGMSTCNDLRIIDNYTRDHKGAGYAMSNCAGVEFSGNESNSDLRGILAENIRNSDVVKNTFIGNTKHAVEFRNVIAVNFSNNILLSNQANRLFISRGSPPDIKGNTFITEQTNKWFYNEEVYRTCPDFLRAIDDVRGSRCISGRTFPEKKPSD
jgi:nitrous oxidase accessory protein NosD